MFIKKFTIKAHRETPEIRNNSWLSLVDVSKLNMKLNKDALQSKAAEGFNQRNIHIKRRYVNAFCHSCCIKKAFLVIY